MKNAASDAWKREGFYLRLSKDRKAGLKKLAEGLANASSPAATVDWAIELALESLGALESSEAKERATIVGTDEGKLSPLAAAIERLSVELELGSERQRSRIEDIAAGVERLADLISGALSESGPQDAATLEEWLGSEIAARSVLVRQVAIVRAKWVSTTRIGPCQSALAFDVELADADGEPLTGSSSTLARVRFMPVGSGSELARSDLSEPIFLACQPAGRGSWRIAPFQKNPDGSIGRQIQA